MLNFHPAVKMCRLYRKGQPFVGCAFFPSPEEAVSYFGDISDNNIYRLIVTREMFDKFFMGNGCGFVVREEARGKTGSLELGARCLGPDWKVAEDLENSVKARFI